MLMMPPPEYLSLHAHVTSPGVPEVRRSCNMLKHTSSRLGGSTLVLGSVGHYHGSRQSRLCRSVSGTQRQSRCPPHDIRSAHINVDTAALPLTLSSRSRTHHVPPPIELRALAYTAPRALSLCLPGNMSLPKSCNYYLNEKLDTYCSLV